MAHVCPDTLTKLMSFLNTFKSSRSSITVLALSLSYGWCKRYEYMDFNKVRAVAVRCTIAQ